MIVVLKHNPNPEQLQSLITWLQEKGIIIHTSIGEGNMLLGLVGDTSKIDADLISALDIVEDVKRVQEPYKNANRKEGQPGTQNQRMFRYRRYGGGRFP